MIDLTFSDAFQACKTFEVLREIIDDVPLHITQDGLKIVALDSGHVAVVVAEWPRAFFKKYEVSTSELTLGLKISNLIKILRFAHKGDILHFQVNDVGDDALTVIIENAERNATFSMKLVDLTADEMSIPEMDIDACITMPSAEFQLLVKDLGSLSDAVTISTNEKSITFDVIGDIGHACITLNDVDIQYSSHIRLGFAIRYLASFSKAAAIIDKVSLKLTNEMPLCVEFKGDVCSLRYYLAPKLDDDDTMGGEEDEVTNYE